MTRQRNDNHSTEFGLWLRQQKEIDSHLGYVTSNIDFLWTNYKTGQWMFIEEKRYMSDVTYPQKQMFAKLHRACSDEPGYEGFHILRFERTNPDDGRIYLNDIEIDVYQLIAFLRFEPTHISVSMKDWLKVATR